MNETCVTAAERRTLRELAARVAAIAALPEQAEKRRRWRAHNGLRPGRPMVLCYPEGAWLECLPPARLRCRDPLLYGWEKRLRMQLHHHRRLRDDHVVDPHFNVGWHGEFRGWGLTTKVEAPATAPPWRLEDVYYLHPNLDITLLPVKGRGAWRRDPPLKEPRDLERITGYRIDFDEAETARRVALANDLFGDLLLARRHGWLWVHAGLADPAANLRGLEQLVVDLFERPAWVHEFLGRLAYHLGQHLDRLERGGYLSSNHESEWVGSGGIGYTDELPAPGFTPEHVRCRDLWGVATAQELANFSPRIVAEFFHRHTIPLLARFGLNCYGCCEPIHHWLPILHQIPRLRRVSISPWCDVPRAAAGLRNRVVFSYKPNPTLVSTPRFDEAALRATLTAAVAAAHQHGCILELIMKDVQTVQDEPWRLARFVTIAREVAERSYG